eukprot:scaffold121392_cov19-Tisochrysis_lutea.AAC.4
MGACTDIVKFAESATMRGSVDWAALSMTPLASLGVASCWTAAATSSLCPSSSRCAHDWLLDNHCYHRAGVTSARVSDPQTGQNRHHKWRARHRVLCRIQGDLSEASHSDLAHEMCRQPPKKYAILISILSSLLEYILSD